MSDDIDRSDELLDMYAEDQRRQHARNSGLDDPDPAVRLATWRNIARAHISVEMCDRLAGIGLPDLALELLRQRGDLP